MPQIYMYVLIPPKVSNILSTVIIYCEVNVFLYCLTSKQCELLSCYMYSKEPFSVMYVKKNSFAVMCVNHSRFYGCVCE